MVRQIDHLIVELGVPRTRLIEVLVEDALRRLPVESIQALLASNKGK